MTTAAAAVPATRTTTGIIMMCVGVACLCVNDALAKTLGETYPPVQILFMRNIIALPFAALVAYFLGGGGALRTYSLGAHMARGLLWMAAATLFFTSVTLLDLAEATALVFAAPLFITALSAFLLRETVGWRRWSAVLVGFLGVLIVVRPGGGSFQPALLLPLATAVLYAVLMIGARWVDPRESVWTLMLYLVGAGALLSALVCPFFWVDLQSRHLWLFAAIAFFGTIGITLMTQAFRLAPATVLAPLDYRALIWASILGWIFWREIPDLATYLGAAIIIVSGVFIVLREGGERDRACE
ncbi:MAG: DMT family transporter [Roseibium sp.]|uniref:DMT family transporter n=1 Tax=Roseibium sp. TaxID=1936156 RepID=UPI0032630433